MEFKVKFGASYQYAVRKYGKEVGLAGLRLARERFPGVKAENVEGTFPTVGEDPKIEIPEAIAIASGVFEECNSVRVNIPEGGLNCFHTYVPVLREGGRVGWESVIDEAAILAAWIKAGFPLQWDPEAEEGEAEDEAE